MFPAHAGPTDALLDQGLTVSLDDAGADREVVGQMARLIHARTLVGEIRLERPAHIICV
jgi:hypothetical protein